MKSKTAPRPRIAIVVDDRLSREKGTLLNRIIQAVRALGEVHLLPGASTEAQVLKRLEEVPFQLVLIPWYRYLAWSKVEALYGLTRTSGPTIAGYFCEPLLPYELGDQADYLRAIFLDFGNQNPREVLVMLRALLQDTLRSGIKPLLESGAQCYSDNWVAGQNLGSKLDAVLGLNDLTSYGWNKRANSIRICMVALWSLVFDIGPGKLDPLLASGSSLVKASLQLGVDSNSLVLRLCYILQGSSPKDLLTLFWPDNSKPSGPAQLLLRYADFLRVHHVAQGFLVEIVVGFLGSAAAETAHANVHTLWVEPLAANLIVEGPFDAPGPTAPHLKHLPSAATSLESRRTEAIGGVDTEELRAKDRFIADANEKIRTLRAQLADREKRISELLAGGIGAAQQPLPPPDAEALLEAFQAKFFDARYQLRQFETQIAELEAKGASSLETEALRRKMAALQAQLNEWIRKLAKTIQSIRGK